MSKNKLYINDYISILTPTYNRAYILPELYKSLVNQTCTRFEWIIVDDGSNDETKAIVNKWINEKKIKIQYLYQKNQGKHIAINTGVQVANGELLFFVDSDDNLTNNAIRVVLRFWATKQSDKKISGIISYRQFPDGRLVGNKLPKGIDKCKLRETGTKYGSIGDKVVIYRTEYFIQYPYPQFIGEKFLGESYVYNLIDDKYDMAILDDKIYNFDYQKDGLSQNFRKLYRNNPNGFLLCYKQSINYCKTRTQKIKEQSHIACLSTKLRLIKEYYSEGISFEKILCHFIGIILYLKIFVFKVSDVKPYIKSEDK